MDSKFWWVFVAISAIKVALIHVYHSTDFEVHRNWLAITHSLPLREWYRSAISEWTLDYPPFFAYFEWLLSQLAKYVDPQMLVVDNLNYASTATVVFQRVSVMVTDLIFAFGVLRCFKALGIRRETHKHFAAEVLLLCNVGLLFVDHIHFQYNGMLFGILLLSIGFLLEDRFLLAAFTFASLLNFKHIFLYMAPAFGVYLLKFYCFQGKNGNPIVRTLKLLAVGLTPFALAFGPFWQDVPQVLSRLFPFKRGLTHAYWAPNFWALYNVADKAAAVALRVQPSTGQGSGTASGLVQEFNHQVLPTVKPLVTFVLAAAFMVPILVKLFAFTSKSDSKLVFLRSLVLCSCSSFMFGWHVHEKAILMCLIPLCLLYILNMKDARYAFLLSLAGHFSLFPLLFPEELTPVKFSLYGAYMLFMYSQAERIFDKPLHLSGLEILYAVGFVFVSCWPLLGLDEKLPFMPLLLTSLHCALGVTYFFIRYYLYALSAPEKETTPKKSSANTKKQKIK